MNSGCGSRGAGAIDGRSRRSAALWKSVPIQRSPSTYHEEGAGKWVLWSVMVVSTRVVGCAYALGKRDPRGIDRLHQRAAGMRDDERVAGTDDVVVGVAFLRHPHGPAAREDAEPFGVVEGEDLPRGEREDRGFHFELHGASLAV